jgi:hypothetical protein
MKVIPLYQVPQSYMFYKNNATGKQRSHRVVNNDHIKER